MSTFRRRPPVRKVTLRALVEQLKLGPPKLRLVRKLFEDGTLDPTTPVDTSDPGEALRGGFEAAAMAVIQQALDGEVDPKEALSRIRELLSSHSKLAGKPGDKGGGDEAAALNDDGLTLPAVESAGWRALTGASLARRLMA